MGLLLPTSEEIRQAVCIYLQFAYEGNPPAPSAEALLPPEGDFDVAAWMTQDMAEIDPPDADISKARSVAVRLGNLVYPNMKLRLSRPPKESAWLFSVDSHDAILHAPAGSSDAAMLEELKAHNAQLAATIRDAWEAAGLMTERSYLKSKISQAKKNLS